MAYLTLKGIVLKRADYRESDRVLTLLTPERGRVEAAARGCRKIKSPLMQAAELFSMGEYVLYHGKGHETVSAFTPEDSFYPLREDLTRLSHAAVMLNLCEQAAQPEEPAEKLFILLARSLKRLAYTDRAPEAVTSAFALHFSVIEGFKPRLNHCARCGRRMEEGEGGYLDGGSGGVCCTACRGELPAARYIGPEQLSWLRAVLIRGVEKTSGIGAYPVNQMLGYAESYMDRRLPEIL